VVRAPQIGSEEGFKEELVLSDFLIVVEKEEIWG